MLKCDVWAHCTGFQVQYLDTRTLQYYCECCIPSGNFATDPTLSVAGWVGCNAVHLQAGYPGNLLHEGRETTRCGTDVYQGVVGSYSSQLRKETER